MIKLYDGGAFLVNGTEIIPESAANAPADKKTAAAGTMAYSILSTHNTSGDPENLKIKFDKLISHDITYVGIIQTARASGLEKFPIPYVLTNCHNSLCAVGGTINEDDHMFGLSAAKKYGGVYVPAMQAVIHQYAREMMTGCGAMILGSDSHTRYGAYGTMAVGEGGPELVKQLLGKTYDIAYPQVVGVYLTGSPRPGVGPQDVALALIGAVFEKAYVKNKVLEFVGPGIANLSADFRIGIDVMTTETTCLSSIWVTDETIREFYAVHGREADFRPLAPAKTAYYDGFIEIDLATIEPMIAMPYHPSYAYPVADVVRDPYDIFKEAEKRAKVSFGDAVDVDLCSKIKGGKVFVDQGIIAGCAGGGFENIMAAADILRGRDIGNGEFSFSVYPASMPIFKELTVNGTLADLMSAGAVIKPAFCGPCFGAGDTPANNAFSIRHSTRNFPNREGSKVQNGQIASVALMDARSIAATAANHGILTPATEFAGTDTKPVYHFDASIYEKRVYDGIGRPDPDAEITFGPNIKDWPSMPPLTENLLLRVVTVIEDPVTTTDELIPSGETSSLRSNPEALSQFALSRKDPSYVPCAKLVRTLEKEREAALETAGTACEDRHDRIVCAIEAEERADDAAETAYREMQEAMQAVREIFPDAGFDNTGYGSTIYAVKPGDGSAREQAASCQKVLGGWANIAGEYATKRYRSNLINWGMLPLLCPAKEIPFLPGDCVFLPQIREVIGEMEDGEEAAVPAVRIRNGVLKEVPLSLAPLTAEERKIITDGCLINYYRERS